MRGNATKSSASSVATPSLRSPVVWDWDIEHADRKREATADAAVHGSIPYQVDRRVLKDVVREKTGMDVGRITFFGAGELSPEVPILWLMLPTGTFHKVGSVWYSFKLSMLMIETRHTLSP